MKVTVNLMSDKLYYSTITIENNHAPVAIGPDMTTIIGPNGSGKSLLATIIEKGWNFRTNRISCPEVKKPKIKKIEFSDIHSLSGLKVEYYQQRYEATANDEVPTVAEVMGIRLQSPRGCDLCRLFDLHNPGNKKINFLSSGELRKLLIINTLLDEDVDMLILDNPYIGLDFEARSTLDHALRRLDNEGNTTIVMIVANPRDIHPDCRYIIPMKDMAILPPEAITSAEDGAEKTDRLFDFTIDLNGLPLPHNPDCLPLDKVVELDDVTVSYGENTIIEHLDWTVRPGEHWALTGPNGSGKSTLLSLLTADNPKAYSQKVTLFDRRRGSGESIWEVKRRVAMISPELALHFHPSGTVETIVAQSLNDTNGLFHPIRPEQLTLAREWLMRLGLQDLATRSWTTLSGGERQMVLIARVMIKQPRLIILDEPFHGLDRGRMEAVRAMIDHLARRAAKQPDRFPTTMIIVSHYAEQFPDAITDYKTLHRSQK